MTLSHLKVSTRLALGFGFSTLVGIVIAMVGLQGLRTLAGELSLLANDRLPKLDKVQAVRENVSITARVVRNLGLYEDPKIREAEKSRIAAARTENAKLLAELDKTVTSSQGRELLKAVVERRTAYMPLVDKAIALSDAGDAAAFRALLIGDLRTAQSAYFQASQAFADHQMKLAVASAHDGETLASRLSIAMLALAALSGIVGAAIGILLTRSLGRALGAEPAEVSQAVQRVAEGDLMTPVAVRPGDTGSVMAAVQRMQQALGEMVHRVRQNADSVASASSQIAHGNQDLSQRTEEQASALQQTSATMTELSGTVRSNSQSAQRASELALGASSTAGEGGEVVGRVVQTMKGIHESSRRIADIIGVIDGIAFQTNILALNAAVEAARAGEQGRGFAVVASEVRSLAQRSAEAAKEIKALIMQSVDQVEQGSTLVDQAGQSMGEIVAAIQRVAAIVSEISEASTEQSNGVGQVETAIGQMDQATQQNAALVEESAAAAVSLQAQARALTEAMAFFRVTGGAAVPSRAPSPSAVRADASGSSTPRAPRSAAPRAASVQTPTAAQAGSGASQPEWASF